jgi:acyl carrier protein
MTQSILEGVQETIRAEFRNPAITVDLTTTAEDVDGWDSLAHARLILALENRFGVEFPAERLFDIDNVGELVELIAAGMRASRGG